LFRLLQGVQKIANSYVDQQQETKVVVKHTCTEGREGVRSHQGGVRSVVRQLVGELGPGPDACGCEVGHGGSGGGALEPQISALLISCSGEGQPHSCMSEQMLRPTGPQALGRSMGSVLSVVQTVSAKKTERSAH